jgi:hypothetical protein
MDIHFYENGSGAPQPRENVKIEDIEIVVYPDRFRVYVHIKVTPFLERPNLLLAAHNEDDRLVSEFSIIETMHSDMEFTMHIRGVPEPAGVYTLTTELFYESRNPPQDRRVETFTVPEASAEG